MDVTFYGVVITLQADSPEEAYVKLCEMFEKAGVEFDTDTFSTDGGETERWTREIWPRID